MPGNCLVHPGNSGLEPHPGDSVSTTSVLLVPGVASHPCPQGRLNPGHHSLTARCLGRSLVVTVEELFPGRRAIATCRGPVITSEMRPVSHRPPPSAPLSGNELVSIQASSPTVIYEDVMEPQKLSRVPWSRSRPLISTEVESHAGKPVQTARQHHVETGCREQLTLH